MGLPFLWLPYEHNGFIHLHTSGPSPPSHIVSDIISRALNQLWNSTLVLIHLNSQRSSLDFRAEILWLGIGGVVTYDLFVLGSKSVYTVWLLACVFVCSLWVVLLVCMLTCLRHTHICFHSVYRAEHWSFCVVTCSILLQPRHVCKYGEKRIFFFFSNNTLVISPVSLSFAIFFALSLSLLTVSCPPSLPQFFLSDVHAKENKECGTFIFASLFCNFTIQ